MTEVASSKSSAPSVQKARVYGPDGASFVTCDCCGESALATNCYYGLHNCSKGGPSKDFIAKFRVIEPKAEAKKGPSKKKSESASSKASTPVKDTPASDHESPETSADENPKSKEKSADKAKKPKESITESQEAKGNKKSLEEKSEPHKEAKGTKKQSEKAEDAKDGRDSTKSKDEDEEEETAEEKAPKQSKALKKQKVDSTKSKTTKSAKGGDEPAEGKPKRGPNPYMLFTKANRAAVLAESPGMKVTEISKVLGAKWSALSAEEKAVWQQKAKAGIESADNDEEVDAAPPKSAYALWSAEERPRLLDEQPKLKPKEVAEILGKRWKKLGEEERARYEQRAEEEAAGAPSPSRSGGSDENDAKPAASPKRKRLSAGEDSEVESDEKSGETDDKEEKQSKIGKQDKKPEGEDVEKDSGEEEEVAGGTQVSKDDE